MKLASSKPNDTQSFDLVLHQYRPYLRPAKKKRGNNLPEGSNRWNMCSQEWEVILEGREESNSLQVYKEGRGPGRGRGRGRPRGSTWGKRDSSAVDSEYLSSP